MPELRLSDKLRELLLQIQGKEITLNELRRELRIEPGSPAWDGIRQQMFNLTREKIVKPSGRHDGVYKVLIQVQPVRVYGRERKQPLTLLFPRNFETMMEMDFAEDIIIREGDLILISGRSNFGKTCLCMNFCAENIDSRPVLMGNEYTTVDKEPSPRFLQRLDNINWVEWVNGTGDDKFTLLPVFSDYAEYIIKDRINIIDWINIDTGEYYLISSIMEQMKRAVGKGNIIAAIQKAEGAASGRGGQFTKDFADVEILLDEYGENEIRLTLGKIKESKKRLTGRNYAFSIQHGVKIINFRELLKCSACYGKGWAGTRPCEQCNKTGYVDA